MDTESSRTKPSVHRAGSKAFRSARRRSTFREWGVTSISMRSFAKRRINTSARAPRSIRVARDVSVAPEADLEAAGRVRSVVTAARPFAKRNGATTKTGRNARADSSV